MKRIFAVALGVLTAIGGFVDIGDLVTNAVVGSRFGMSLAWVVVVGVVGICVFANMAPPGGAARGCAGAAWGDDTARARGAASGGATMLRGVVRSERCKRGSADRGYITWRSCRTAAKPSARGRNSNCAVRSENRPLRGTS